MITHISGISPTMTKLFWKILCDHFACVLDSVVKSLKAMCFLHICQKNQNKTKIQSLKIDFFVSTAQFQALIIDLHHVQPVDFQPVVKLKKERGHVHCTVSTRSTCVCSWLCLQPVPARLIPSVIPAATSSFGAIFLFFQICI